MFVVVEGRGVYTLGDVEVSADAGDMVFVPANTWHSFRTADDSILRHIAVFDSTEIRTESVQDA